MRTFETGATRDQDANKPDFEGFLSPLVLDRYAEYMHKHRKQADGTLRDSDNWQKGIPLPAYMKSGFRHFLDWWKEHRGHRTNDGLEEALCALIFNASGYLHEVLKDRNSHDGVGPNIIPPPDYDPNSVAFSAQGRLAELAQEAQRRGMYADADIPEKSANVNSAPKWSPQWLAEQGVPAESSYIASFSPNGSRLATEDEVAGLREHLTAEQLREYGIGDVEPETLRGIPDSFTDSRGNRITRRDVRSDRHSSQNVTDVVHSAHPMHAEAQLLADEPPEDRL